MKEQGVGADDRREEAAEELREAENRHVDSLALRLMRERSRALEDVLLSMECQTDETVNWEARLRREESALGTLLCGLRFIALQPEAQRLGGSPELLGRLFLLILGQPPMHHLPAHVRLAAGALLKQLLFSYSTPLPTPAADVPPLSLLPSDSLVSEKLATALIAACIHPPAHHYTEHGASPLEPLELAVAAVNISSEMDSRLVLASQTPKLGPIERPSCEWGEGDFSCRPLLLNATVHALRQITSCEDATRALRGGALQLMLQLHEHGDQPADQVEYCVSTPSSLVPSADEALCTGVDLCIMSGSRGLEVVSELELARLIELSAQGTPHECEAAGKALRAFVHSETDVDISKVSYQLFSLTRNERPPQLRLWAANAICELCKTISYRPPMLVHGVRRCRLFLDASQCPHPTSFLIFGSWSNWSLSCQRPPSRRAAPN